MSQTSNASAFANTEQGKTLLIVEALSLINRRIYTYDDTNLSVTIALNTNETEIEMYGKFLLIAANVFLSFCGVPPELPVTSSVCNDNGFCTDTFPLETNSYRESPMISLIRMLNSLYGTVGTSTYPTPNLINGNCC